MMVVMVVLSVYSFVGSFIASYSQTKDFFLAFKLRSIDLMTQQILTNHAQITPKQGPFSIRITDTQCDHIYDVCNTNDTD